MTDTNGNSLGTMKYYPYGSTRSGSVPTDELFTGQKLDGTGLYYYGARYYDPVIGRFISPDTIVPYPANPQSYNRYSYCRNNPLKYVDPTGNLDGYGGYDYRDPNEYMLVIGLSSYGKNSEYSSGLEANQTKNLEKTSGPDLPLEDNSDSMDWALGATAALLADDAIPVLGWIDDVAIPVILVVAVIGYATEGGSILESSAQDKKLTSAEVDRLEKGTGESAEDMKGGKHAGRRDLYKKPNGDVVVKPKGGKGPGEPTGYNINDY